MPGEEQVQAARKNQRLVRAEERKLVRKDRVLVSTGSSVIQPPTTHLPRIVRLQIVQPEKPRQSPHRLTRSGAMGRAAANSGGATTAQTSGTEWPPWFCSI